MDMRTGKLYDSLEAARAAGVPAEDLAEVTLPTPDEARRGVEPTITFPKSVFGSLKSRARELSVKV